MQAPFMPAEDIIRALPCWKGRIEIEPLGGNDSGLAPAVQCASLLREAMWSMISELHLASPGVDYLAYTLENPGRLEAALDLYKTQDRMHRS